MLDRVKCVVGSFGSSVLRLSSSLRSTSVAARGLNPTTPVGRSDGSSDSGAWPKTDLREGIRDLIGAISVAGSLSPKLGTSTNAAYAAWCPYPPLHVCGIASARVSPRSPRPRREVDLDQFDGVGHLRPQNIPRPKPASVKRTVSAMTSLSS